MNKFQNVNFKTVGDCLDYLPENELRIVEPLRNLILETLPEPKEKLNFNVPYYQCFKNVCFIWPGSIPWGGIKQGVLLGFVHGHLLLDDEQYLQPGKRRFIKTRQFFNLADIDFGKVRYLLHEASAVDAELRCAARYTSKNNK